MSRKTGQKEKLGGKLGEQFQGFALFPGGTCYPSWRQTSEPLYGKGLLLSPCSAPNTHIHAARQIGTKQMKYVNLPKQGGSGDDMLALLMKALLFLLLGRRDYCLISVQHRSTESKIRSPANQARARPLGTLPRVGGDAGQGWEGHCLKSPLYSNHHCRHLTQNIMRRRTSEVNRIIPTVLMGKWSLSKGK